jgi:hypothetical protein
VKQFVIDTTSLAYKRFTEAGFSIDEMSVLDSGNGEIKLRGKFTCVCGKVEYFQIIFNFNVYMDISSSTNLPISFVRTYTKDYEVDIARLLEVNGAVSVEHLRKDGYTEEQIKEIRKPYERIAA